MAMVAEAQVWPGASGATCAAAPFLARLPLQRAYFFAVIELYFSSRLRAQRSRLPAPARPALEEWGGAAEAAPPPEGSGLPRTSK